MTQVDLLTKFGNPVSNTADFEKKWMIVWVLPKDIQDAIPRLPGRIYINKVIQAPLEAALRAVIAEGVQDEIRTWDGCFAVRTQRKSSVLSMHAFGIAIDMNAVTNPLVTGVTPDTRDALRKSHVSWSEKFLDCFRKNGWNCGADWNTRLDGMHFELK